ncbi:sigma-54-dependent transcriptional regulator [Desulfobacula toluolica]|uniref:DNA-binding transcriptional regulator NtrC n=1 Tax=Desulfobacula toluolica (strain DSM 7467 / Tol2) TaxID=651182 RepID=K0NLZ9_DESTT|nr:sigma-54 dependent transcriptional regulator [Desulfobacula toluolica]CCK79712.1 two component system response regulator, sigma54-specific [Desulfobacula toluolica Tol2]
MANLLIVDDEHPIRESISMFMSEKGHSIHTASSVNESISVFKECTPDVVILDIRLPDGSGLDALSQMRDFYPLSKVIMITAFQDMETTIEAMKRGAYDYIHKPLDADELEKTVNDAIASFYEDAKTAVKDKGKTVYNESEIVGKSRAMKEVYKTIGMLCQNRATALIMGETGTGKEIVARRIHLSSTDCEKPFITFDCSAVVDTLLESELFGHEKGAFTGAVTLRPGKIELAGDGTLFLDEIGELPLNLQGKLLGFLERKRYMRVGGKVLMKSKCRIIAATNRDLETMVTQKTFRADLYYRLKVVNMTLPPLRHRLSDIKDLVAHFVQKSADELGVEHMTLQDGCIERLKHHPWTGNVRELENVIVSASIQSRGSVILLDDLETILSYHPVSAEESSSSQSLSQMERQHIFNILESVQWNKTHASHILKISLPTLRKKIKKYHLDTPD